jgi:hypothetical protein
MSWTIHVYDERPEIVELRGDKKHVATFQLVPESWTTKDVIERFGIAEHLTVYRSFDGGKWTVIQEGRRYRVG